MPASFIFEDSLLARPCETAHPAVKLRRLALDDAERMAVALNDLSVARNLIAVPHPYRLEDAHEFIEGPATSPHMLCAAIEIGGNFAGCVAIDALKGPPELGYWLAAPFHGAGLGTAAIHALVDLVFAATDVPQLTSGHFVDNAPSAAVLARLGFRRTGIVETRSRARPETVRLVTMALPRAEWAALQPEILTPRLSLRTPVLADAPEIALLARDLSLGLTTAAIAKPFTLEDARSFVLSAARVRKPAGVAFSMRLREDNALVGGIGWTSPEPGMVELGYWLGAGFRGQGLATEAARAAIEAAFSWTEAGVITARCRVANPTSRGVLERCGFQWESASLIRTPGSGGSFAVDVFRLERDVFLSLKDWGQSAIRGLAGATERKGAA